MEPYYPKRLRRKDLKKISKYPCDEAIKEAYKKYLTNYSFEEFVDYCLENSDENMLDLIVGFANFQVDRYEPNSLVWLSHLMIFYMILADVNRDYGYCHDAFLSVIQLAVLAFLIKMLIDESTFDESTFDDIPFPDYCTYCFEKIFMKCPDLEFDLKKDCNFAYSSFNYDFEFTNDEFYLKVQNHFDEYGY